MQIFIKYPIPAYGIKPYSKYPQNNNHLTGTGARVEVFSQCHCGTGAILLPADYLIWF